MILRENLNQITQPIVIEQMDGQPVLYGGLTEKRVLRGLPHLQGLLEAVEENQKLERSHHYIIVSPREDLALQAVSAVLSCLEAEQEETGEDEITILESWEGEETGLGCLMMKQEELMGPDLSGQQEIQLMKQLMEGDKIQKKAESMKNYFGFYISCGSRIRSRFADCMREQKQEVQILWLRQVEWNEDELERLMFEGEFQMIHIRLPEISYYADLLQRYLELCGYSLEYSAKGLTERLMRYRGSFFCENDLYQYAEQAIVRMKRREGFALKEEDFELPRIVRERSARRMFQAMEGLEKVKKQIEGICSQRIVQERFRGQGDGRMLYSHLAFSGAPGTGKSMAARAYADILAEEGIIARRFVVAQKSDLTGQYLGQTAPKVLELFNAADGGILFVDEAGCLTENDLFTREAVTEFVRLMEERSQTTVIFASYPDRIQALLKQDPGLSSRISRIIEFPSYTDDQLINILRGMCKELRVVLGRGCEPAAREFLRKARERKGETFGNAREIRRLLEAAFQNYCVRVLRKQRETGVEPDGRICRSDLLTAAEELLSEPGGKERTHMGFTFPCTEEKGGRLC